MPDPLQPKVLSWKEAEDLFIARKGYASADYYQLSDFARQQGFTITNIASYQMMMRVKRKLEQVIATGGNLAEFRTWATMSALGWGRAYTELIFRQAVFGSYAQARFQQMNQPAVRSTFEMLIYETAGDERVRDTHAQMHLTEWLRNEFPSGWWPQNGFNCRCEVRAVTREMAREIGAKPWPVRTKIPTPDKGFVRNYNNPESQRLLMNGVLRNLRTELGR